MLFNYGCSYIYTDSHKQILLLIGDCHPLGLSPCISMLCPSSIFPPLSTCHPYFSNFCWLLGTSSAAEMEQMGLEKISWVMKFSCLIYNHSITVSKVLDGPLARSSQGAGRLHVLAAHLGDCSSTRLP